MLRPLSLALLAALAPLAASAAEWTFEWTPGPDEPAALKAEVTPLKYGKTWAYSVEIDDNPATVLSVSEPLLRRHEFTDAPPGVPGGRALPFVGGVAIMWQRVVSTNTNYLDLDELQALEQRGWRALNHSYWHTGNHWNPEQALKPAQFRRELYWSQALFAALLREGRADIHFVYPNGDYNYGPFLREFGILSASRVGGRTRTLAGPPDSLLDLNRNWLDQDRWVATGDALHGAPETEPFLNDFVIDFTHGMNADAASDNRLRWETRLKHLSSRFGKGGSDTMWCAPTSEVVAYSLAAREAKVTAARGRVKVSLPDGAPGSALTLKLSGVSPRSEIAAPAGGVVHRRDREVWITTPVIGQVGAPAPKPALKRIYSGPATTVKLPAPAKIAGVRLQQNGKLNSELAVTLVAPDGGTENLVPAAQAMPNNWGVWLLFPTIPDGPPALAREVQVDPEPALKEMEIWAVTE